MSKNITKAKHRFPLRQIRQIPKFLRRTWPVLVLTALTIFIAFLNYEPGTFLLGWDNLSSEFSPLLNLKRALFSVWQEYQSLGLLGGMAHGADLPRVLAIFLISLLPHFPISLIRYLFTFLPLALGPLGVYYFLYHRLFKTQLDSRTTQYASFLGSLFYLLNLSTMQTFFTPFETFTSFYGALPWLLYFITGYLEIPSWSSLLTIFIVSFISAPSFYVETIFFVFLLLLIPIFSEVFFSPKNKKKSFSKILKTFFSVLFPQLFWFLPVVFFVLTNGHVGEQAKINLMSSPETYFRNLQYGTLQNVALLKGFYFSFLDLAGQGKFDYLLNVWRHHLDSPFISSLGYLLFTVVLIGLYYSFVKKFFWTKSLTGMLFLCLFFLLGGGLLINSVIPLIGELLRSPFTKFSIPLSFVYSCFFAIGSVFLLDLFTYLHHKFTYPLTLFTVALALIIFTSPVFSGNLISTSMRLSLPDEYQELFAYLKSQDPSTRIANFPQITFWGWNYYDWGYRGSGFLWYGIQQPILDRAFDVWEKSSEKYYEEISTALYSGNKNNFENILDKYAISWILLDKHVITPDSKTSTQNQVLENFLKNSDKFTLDKSFADQIFLYKVNLNPKPQNLLSVISPVGVDPRVDHRSPSNNLHPFDSLTLRPDTNWVEKAGHLSTIVPLSRAAELTIPSLTSTENLLPVKLEYQKTSGSLTLRLTQINPIIFLDQRQIDLPAEPVLVSIPVDESNNFIVQIGDQFFPLQIPAEVPNLGDFITLSTFYLPSQNSFRINIFDGISLNSQDLTDQFAKAEPVQCYSQKPNRKIEKIFTNNSISLIGTDVVGCLSVPLPFVPSDSLISLTFAYSSATLTPGNANITGKEYQTSEIPQSLEPRSVARQAQFFATSTGKYQQANLLLEAADTRTLQEITYRNIALVTHPLIFSTSAKLPETPAQVIALKGDEQSLQVSIPVNDTAYDIRQLPESNGLFPENLNCDQYNNGQTNKVVSKDGFLYQSKNAIECDYLNLRQLPHSLNYLISVRAQHQKGLPLTLCLENQSTFRCDVHERLQKTNLSQSMIQPISNPEESVGYTLHLFNQSFGNRLTSNLLKEITIRPIPLSFLKSISISDTNTTNVSVIPGLTRNPSNEIQFSSTHPAEFLYTASIIPNVGVDPRVDPKSNPSLSLYQTKSPYWQAIEVPEKDLSLPTWQLIGKVLFTYPNLSKLPHSDTHLWHNAWTLPDCTSNCKSVSLIILYLPQYLEFFGFVFLTTPLFVFLYLKLFTKKKK